MKREIANTQRIDVERLRSELGEPRSKLTKDFACDMIVYVPLKARSSEEREAPRRVILRVLCNKAGDRPVGVKSSKHRLFVVCPYCGLTVPAGRYAQHLTTKDDSHGT